MPSSGQARRVEPAEEQALCALGVSVLLVGQNGKDGALRTHHGYLGFDREPIAPRLACAAGEGARKKRKSTPFSEGRTDQGHHSCAYAAQQKLRVRFENPQILI